MTTRVVERDWLVDVNVLVALVHDAHEHSATANAWLETVLRRGAVRVCRVGQLGFLRLIVSPVVFAEHALQPGEAWRAFDRMMSDDRFAYVEEPSGLEAAWRDCSAALQPGASLGTDVYLAAFARAAKLEIVSFDAGFRRFSDCEVRILS